MIPFVFRKSVKTRTKPGYRIIIFLGNVLLISCALPNLPLSPPLYLPWNFYITLYTTYSLIAIHLSCQLCRCYHLSIRSDSFNASLISDAAVTNILSSAMSAVTHNVNLSRWLCGVTLRVSMRVAIINDLEKRHRISARESKQM